ncbi:response regulator [Pseudorhodoferax sp.]|uniref:response regulator n=1 Tax=Pseudorhodoferax sp. TaxID=1993553 RepID=UPI0039E3D378
MDLSTRILIVDDDAGIRELVSGYLGKHGFQADSAADPPAMRELLARQRYDLIVMDVMMPGEDGLTALRALLRDGGPPVIMLSAVGTDVDRIVGLEIGAEDYLAKPCNPRELLARIRTVLRRAARGGADAAGGANAAAPADAAPPPCLCFDGWRLNLQERLLHAPEGQPVALSDGEFRLLRAFAEHPRRVLTRDQLMDYALGADSQAYDRAIDVQISRLRRKLSELPGGAGLIRTVRHEGYMFVPAVTRG